MNGDRNEFLQLLQLQVVPIRVLRLTDLVLNSKEFKRFVKKIEISKVYGRKRS